MSVLVVATTKGGAGKTRTTVNLAGTFWADGHSVMVIDADPRKRSAINLDRFNKRMASLAQEGKAPAYSPIAIDNLADLKNDADLTARIIQYSGKYDVVLIDLAGSANQMMLLAMASADMVLIPVQASDDDVAGVEETYPSVEAATSITRREIPVRVLFTRTPSGFPTNIGKQVRKSLEDAGYNVLTPEFMNRTVFQEQSFTGYMPTVEAPDSGPAQNIRAIYNEICVVLGASEELCHG